MDKRIQQENGSESIRDQVDNLPIQVFPSRAAMGAAAGEAVSRHIRELLRQQDTVRVVFAAAPSQGELLDYLAADQRIDWSRIEAFHMDEYIGLPPGAPQRFAVFLNTHLFDRVRPGRVHLIDDAPGVQAACASYAALLQEAPIDVVCLGIGENGHIAFNDPPVADFRDPALIKAVVLDEACRQQQVNDGCFARLDEVPRQALTLTIPALMAGRFLCCVVPGRTKSRALKHVLGDEVSTAWPASILRRHPACTLFTDLEAYHERL